MEKRHFFETIAALILFPLCVCTAVFAGKGFTNPLVAEPGDNYSFTLDSTKFAVSSLGSEFNTADPKKFSTGDYVQQTFDKPDSPTINYFLAKKDSSNNLVLAPGGQVFNCSSSGPYYGRITGISSMVVNYSGGALYAQDGDAGSCTIYGKKVAITSGTPVSFESLPNFVMISNSRANTTISSITFNYSCQEAGYIVGRLGTKYNGAASNGTAYTLERNGSSITFNGQSGTISVNANGTFTMSLNSGAVTYSGSISSDYKTLSIASTTGSALDVNELNRVYVMDDFEGYSQTGTGLRSGKTVASDLRFSYYGDYGGGGYSSWVSSSSFDSAQSADYLNLTTAVKHGGSKSATFKGWTGGWTRAWTRETFDMQHHYNFGSGNKLSFWAHGAYTNTGCTTESTNAAKIRVQVYYEKFEITDSNRNSTTYGSGTNDFTIAAGSGWQEYSFSINPNKPVYAINVMVDNSTISSYKNVFIPIDDIEISTNPIYAEPKAYEETSTRFTKSYRGTVKVLTYTFDIKIALGANGYIYAYAGADMQPTNYTITGNQIVIVTTGSYSGYTFGTWTGTLSNNNNTITIQKDNITGSIKSQVKSSTITLNESTIVVDGSEGDSSLQTKLGKAKKPDNWENYSDLSNEINQTSSYHIQGNSSIKVAPNSSYSIRVFMNSTYAQSISFVDVSFWYYVPAGVKYTISLYGLNSYTPPASGGAAQVNSVVYQASDNVSGWRYMSMGINSSYRKNFFIFIDTTSATTYLDYITVYPST